MFQEVKNPCESMKCPELCVNMKGGVGKCLCSSHKTGNDCADPTEFLLFGQKNKISRMMESGGSSSWLDVVLPIQKARDIRSLTYDRQTDLIYWVDHGSKRKKNKEHHSSSKISIKRAYANGTMPERR